MDESEHIIVPDVAHPIRGYKWLYFSDGKFYGPGHTSVPGMTKESSLWIPGVVKEATCPIEGCKETPCSPHQVAEDKKQYDKDILGMIDQLAGLRAIQEGQSIRQNFHIIGSGCGIYAYKKPSQINPTGIGFRVSVTVDLWGKVYEYSEGWRAQYGMIVDATLVEPDSSTWQVHGFNRRFSQRKHLRKLQRELNKLLENVKDR